MLVSSASMQFDADTKVLPGLMRSRIQIVCYIYDRSSCAPWRNALPVVRRSETVVGSGCNTNRPSSSSPSHLMNDKSHD
jgi:hypothetical protein